MRRRRPQPWHSPKNPALPPFHARASTAVESGKIVGLWTEPVRVPGRTGHAGVCWSSGRRIVRVEVRCPEALEALAGGAYETSIRVGSPFHSVRSSLDRDDQLRIGCPAGLSPQHAQRRDHDPSLSQSNSGVTETQQPVRVDRDLQRASPKCLHESGRIPRIREDGRERAETDNRRRFNPLAPEVACHHQFRNTR